MSAEQEPRPFFEIEIKDGVDLDYFRWKDIQHKIAQISTDCAGLADITNERTPPFNYLLKTRFTFRSKADYEKFCKIRGIARKEFTDKEFHDHLTLEEARGRLER